MKRVLFLFAALALVSGLSFGTIYYVDATSGNDSWDGLAPAYVSGTNGPWKTCAKVNASTFSPDDRIQFKRGETWAERLLPISSGTSGHPIVFEAYGTGANPIITGGAETSSIVASSRSYLTFNDLVGTTKKITIASSSNIIFNRHKSLNTNDVCYSFQGTNGAVAMNYCIAHGASTHGVSATSQVTLTIDNCLIYENTQNGVYVTHASATVNIRNSIITGNSINSASYYGIYRSAGTATYQNSLVLGASGWASRNVSSGVTDSGGNITELIKNKTSRYQDNYFVLTFDDQGVDYWSDTAAALAPYDGHFTAFLSSVYDITPQEEIDIAALAAAGHEIAVHNWSHSALDCTAAFVVTSTNTNPTVDVDVPGAQIILWCDEAGNRIAFSWAGNKTITDLKAALTGKGWTITQTVEVNANDSMRLSGLADSSGAQACPYSPQTDVSSPTYQYWVNEVLAIKDYIASLTGITPTTGAPPYNRINDAFISWAVGKLDGYRQTVASSAAQLSSINIYKIYSVSRTEFLGDGTEAVVRRNMRSMIEYCRNTGRIFVLYSHNATELSINQITWMADELSKAGLKLQTFGSAVAAIRADHSTTDNITWTKTYPDVSDFHLLPGSPCINAGTDVGLTSDYEGKRVPRGNAPDIGAYEYYRRKAALFLLLFGN